MINTNTIESLWNDDLSLAPLNIEVLTTEVYLKNHTKYGYDPFIKTNTRVEVTNKGNNCWWTHESKPIAWMLKPKPFKK